MKTEVIKLCEKARGQIDTPEKWCQESHAYTKEGKKVRWSNPDACRWCLESAVWLHGFNETNHKMKVMTDPMFDAFRILESVVGSDISVFNDMPETEHEDVMKAIDDAIDMAAEMDADFDCSKLRDDS